MGKETVMMQKRAVWVAERVDDLEGVDQEGTRLVTDNGQYFEREANTVGRLYWIAPGSLEPYYVPLRDWMPAYILPPRRLHEIPPSV
jgi:hypothetical protein